METASWRVRRCATGNDSRTACWELDVVLGAVCETVYSGQL